VDAVRETLMSKKVLSLLLPDVVADCALRKPTDRYSSQQHLAQLAYNERSGFCWPYDSLYTHSLKGRQQQRRSDET